MLFCFSLRCQFIFLGGWLNVYMMAVFTYNIVIFNCLDCLLLQDATDQDQYILTPVGLLCIDEGNPQLNPSKVGIILEGHFVMDDLASLPQAFCILFGLIYALHLDYPKYMKNTFSFVQQVMLSLGKSQLAPKLQSLKNQLSV